MSKLDRLCRSVLDFVLLADEAKWQGWALVCLDLALDMTTPSGELTAGMLALFAQYERRIIGQRTREGLAAARAKGVRLGRPTRLPDEVVSRILMARQNGATLQRIADELERPGGADLARRRPLAREHGAGCPVVAGSSSMGYGMKYDHLTVTAVVVSESRGWKYTREDGWVRAGSPEGPVADAPPRFRPLSVVLDQWSEDGYTFLFLMSDPGPDRTVTSRRVMIRKQLP